MVSLDLHQSRVMVAYRKGVSVAILGGAGSGKSFLIRQILQEARAKHGNHLVSACALTNQAASEFGGMTLHSMLGAPPSWPFQKEKLMEIIMRYPEKVEVIRVMQILILEEAFLLTSQMFDALDHVLRHLSPPHLRTLPLGGRQIILAGDPYQLEPVGISRNSHLEGPIFLSETWLLTFGGYGNGVVAFLQRNHRQSRDEEFFDILNRIRYGATSDDDLKKLNNTSKQQITSPSTHTTLCLRRKSAEKINVQVLSDTPGELIRLRSIDKFYSAANYNIQKQLDGQCSSLVTIKVGCEVLLTRRVDGLLPGTRATITSIRDRSPTKISNISSEQDIEFTIAGLEETFTLSRQKFHAYNAAADILAVREQYPVIPAYAITVHRCQGLTLSRVAMDFSMVSTWIPNGMVYVVLSRCTGLKGLWIKGLMKYHIRVSPYATTFMQKAVALRMCFPYRVIGRFPSNFRDEEKSRLQNRRIETAMKAPKTTEMKNKKRRVAKTGKFEKKAGNLGTIQID